MKRKIIYPVRTILFLIALSLFTSLKAQKQTISGAVPAAYIIPVPNSGNAKPADLKIAPNSLLKAVPLAYTVVEVGYGHDQISACSFSEARFICSGCILQPGTTVYWTPSLVNPILNRTLLTDNATKKVWTLNPSTGTIVSFTGNYCQ